MAPPSCASLLVVTTVQKRFRATMIALLLLATLTVSALAVEGRLSTQGQHPNGSAPRSLLIRGHVRGLFPGRSSMLRLRVRNPLSVRVKVLTLKVHVRRGLGPLGRCPAKMLRIKPWRGHRRIQAGHVRRFRLAVRLRLRAPDRCQGARWHLTYDARSARS